MFIYVLVEVPREMEYLGRAGTEKREMPTLDNAVSMSVSWGGSEETFYTFSL